MLVIASKHYIHIAIVVGHQDTKGICFAIPTSGERKGGEELYVPQPPFQSSIQPEGFRRVGRQLLLLHPLLVCSDVPERLRC